MLKLVVPSVSFEHWSLVLHSAACAFGDLQVFCLSFVSSRRQFCRFSFMYVTVEYGVVLCLF